MLGGNFGLLKGFILLGLGLAVAVGLAGTGKPPQRESAAANATPSSYAAGPSEVVIERAADGHFWVEGEVNGEAVQFLIDTGASHVILTQEDAERVGFHLSEQDFTVSYATANGRAAAAPVRLAELAVGDISVANVVAAVNGAPLPQSLLGMSFLERLAGFEAAGDRLILKR